MTARMTMRFNTRTERTDHERKHQTNLRARRFAIIACHASRACASRSGCGADAEATSGAPQAAHTPETRPGQDSDGSLTCPGQDSDGSLASSPATRAVDSTGEITFCSDITTPGEKTSHETRKTPAKARTITRPAAGKAAHRHHRPARHAGPARINRATHLNFLS